MRIWPFLLGAALLAGCGAPPPVTGCAAEDGLDPVCGFTKPEDLELLPDGGTLLVSQMGMMDGSAPGALAFYDTRSGTITRLPQFIGQAEVSWGDPACATPPGAAFSPHGIDLVQRPDLRWQVLVVNHGGRESVEIFELLDQAGAWRLEWRGCVVPPDGTYMNDVAGLPGGDFLVTHMFPRHGPTVGGINLHMLRGLIGFDTGVVLRCTPAGQCAAVPGTTAPFPNGIQTDAAGTTLYLNAYLAGEVRKISLADGNLLGSASVQAPDNSQWSADGKLLVASQTGGMGEMNACFDVTSGACGAGFEIVELDPQTMETRVLLAHRGAPMGAATVAQQVGEELFLGSFAGDRMLRVPLARTAPAAPAATPDAPRTP